MSMEDFIITVYCLIDELLKKQIGNEKSRKRGFYPALSDSETITMEIISEFLGIDTDKGAWEYFGSSGIPLDQALNLPKDQYSFGRRKRLGLF